MSEQSDKKTMDENEGKNADLTEGSETQEVEAEPLKTRLLPAFVMLLGGAVSSVVCYLNQYSLKDMGIIVLCTLLVFYILGLILKKLFDSFHMEKRQGEAEEKDKEKDEHGEVIRKEVQSEGQDN